MFILPLLIYKIQAISRAKAKTVAEPSPLIDLHKIMDFAITCLEASDADSTKVINSKV